MQMKRVGILVLSAVSVAAVSYCRADPPGKVTTGVPSTQPAFRDIVAVAKLKGLIGTAQDLSFSPDGTVLAAACGEDVILWDWKKGQILKKLTDGQSRYLCAAFDPSGKRIVVGCYGGSIQLWDVGTGKVVERYEGARDTIRCVAFAPDGQRFMAGGSDGMLALWQIGQRAPSHVFQAKGRMIMAARFLARQDRAVSLGWLNPGLTVWDLRSNTAVRRIEVAAWCMVMMPGDSQCIVGNNTRVRIFNVGTGKEVRSLLGHANPVWSASVSPDGRYILTSSLGDDKVETPLTAKDALILWDAQSGRLLKKFRADEGDGSFTVQFAPTGRTVATSTGSGGSIVIWEIKE